MNVLNVFEIQQRLSQIVLFRVEILLRLMYLHVLRVYNVLNAFIQVNIFLNLNRLREIL